MLSVIGQIENKIQKFISFYGIYPAYIILGAGQWSRFIRFYCQNEKIKFKNGQLYFDDIPVLRTISPGDFLDAVGGTEHIKVKEFEGID